MLTRDRMQTLVFISCSRGWATGLLYSGAASGLVWGGPSWALEQEKLAGVRRVTAPVGSGDQRPGERMLERRSRACEYYGGVQCPGSMTQWLP